MKRKKYTLEKILVTGYAAEGKSVARQDGKVIFIEGAVPGDVVDVFVSTNKKDYGEGKAIFIHEYSKERTTPFCKHFGVCGGCKWQMLPYEKQLEYKQQEVAQNFRRIGKVALPEMMPILGSEDTRYYRNKLEFTFSNKEYTVERPKKAPLPPEGGFLDPEKTNSFSEFGGGVNSSFTPGSVHPGELKTSYELQNNGRSISTDGAANHFQHQNAQIAASKHIEEGTVANSTILENFSATAENKNPPSGGRGALGYHVPRLFDKIIDIEECFLMEDVNNNIRNSIRNFALQNGYSFYDIKNHTGWLRNIIIRNCTTGELMINICLG
ncbi:MAG: TRAM domain-containing protein, partial [Ferruginibacter sp.]